MPLKVLNENDVIKNISRHVSLNDLDAFIYPNKSSFIKIANNGWIGTESRRIYKESGATDNQFPGSFYNDLSRSAIILNWTKYKQIYRFDSNFLDLLLNSDNISIAKNTFNYLPVNSFYVELPDQDVTETTVTGLFITVKLIRDVWVISAVSIANNDANNLSMPMTFDIRNEDIEIGDDYDDIYPIVKAAVHSICDDPDYKIWFDKLYDAQGEMYARTAKLIYNILTFLSSTTFPEESEYNKDETFIETTKFVKTNKKISNKVKTTNVGYRIGNASRKWKIANESGGSSIKTGIHVCPHYRRAHYHSFWYGKKGEERVKRVKWIAGIFVNAKEGDDIAATIHTVENEECAQ